MGTARIHGRQTRQVARRLRITQAATVTLLTALAVAGCGGKESPSETAEISRPLVTSSGPDGDALPPAPGAAEEPPTTAPTPGLPERGVGSGQGGCSGGQMKPANDNVTGVMRATACLLNAERRSRGLRPLRFNSLLRRAAEGHARDMVARRYFAHESPSGVGFGQRVRTAGYGAGGWAWTVGENLAWGTGAKAEASQIVQAWMHSPGHRANILNPRFREIGLGIAVGVPRGSGPGATYTTAFGARSRA